MPLANPQKNDQTEPESIRRHRTMYERRLRELARMADEESPDYASQAIVPQSSEVDLATA